MDLFGHIDEPEEAAEDDISGFVHDDIDVDDTGSNHFSGPRFSQFCNGHAQIEKTLLDLYRSGRFPHGLIFAGPKGIGKATMAFRLMRFLLKNGPAKAGVEHHDLDVPYQDVVSKRIRAQAHLDALVLERGFDDGKGRLRAALDVDELRKVAPFLRLTASEGGWRIVLIDDADTMNRNAQNALLKILEEPPPQTVLILIAHRPWAMISTIKSRTVTLPFHPLDRHALGKLLLQARPDISPRAADDLIDCADGSLGKAIEYADHKADLVYASLAGILQDYPRWDWPNIHRLADQLAFADGEKAFEIFEDTVLRVFATLCRSKATGEPPAQGQYTDLYTPFLAWPLLRLLDTSDIIETVFDKTKAANLDKRQAVLSVFSLIAG